MRNEIDNPNYNDTNCRLGVAGYMTPDEKEIERLNKHIESLTDERDALKKRVEELEQGLNAVRDDCHEMEMQNALKADQLQAARKLAEREVTDYGKYLDGSPGHMLATFQRVEMARDFLKTLEGLNP